MKQLQNKSIRIQANVLYWRLNTYAFVTTQANLYYILSHLYGQSASKAGPIISTHVSQAKRCGCVYEVALQYQHFRRFHPSFLQGRS